ncbi:hypothetical protein N1851_008024 [Merluccius polli]|uniref:Uncharacterized protein n=1 Tax=Merluccius polli TaxID=89951 RepID=A0AA47P4T0_MERPO|nr:hypothetical protein N1851_008024 [Merluccius polli]
MKYQALIFESQRNGWKAWNLPVDVGCRGLAGQSLWRHLDCSGLLDCYCKSLWTKASAKCHKCKCKWIEGPARKRLIANIAKQAEAASRWIWIKWIERWQSQPGDGLTTS